MDEDKKPRGPGRPLSWHEQISAPEKALEFYRLLASLADDDAFDICHVFNGARNGNAPIIKWQGRTKSIASIAGAYLSLDTHRKKCTTAGCCNPLHYTRSSPDVFVSAEKNKEFVPETLAPTGAEYAEIVEYFADKDEWKLIKPYKFESVRPLIDPLDLTDAALQMALEYLNKQ